MCLLAGRGDQTIDFLSRIRWSLLGESNQSTGHLSPSDMTTRFNDDNLKSEHGQLERYLLICQILIVKITIIALLVQMEELKSMRTLTGWTLSASLMVAFMLMHTFYEKYHNLYSINTASQLTSNERQSSITSQH